MSTPTLKEIIQRMNTDIVKVFNGVDPTIQASFFKAIITSMAGRFREFYGDLSLLQEQLLLNSSTGTFLDNWGSDYKVSRLPASYSLGQVIATGTVGTNIPASTILNSSTGVTYETQTSENINTVIYNGVSVSLNDLIVTCTKSNHGFATGMTVNVTDTTGGEIVGNYVINVTDSNTFSFSINNFISNGPFGTATITVNMATLSIISQSLGSNTNQQSGSKLTFDSALAGVNNSTFVTLSGITGGSDQEDDESYKNRVLYKIRHNGSYFSVFGYISTLLSFSGVTRAWVRPTYPAILEVTAYYVRDNEEDIFPSSIDLNNIKNQLLVPAEIPESNFHLEAPIEKEIDFSFTSISPDTISMQQSIKLNLQNYFRNEATMGFEKPEITLIDIDRVLQNTIDPSTGKPLENYTLATPISNISVNSDELPTLGTVSFS